MYAPSKTLLGIWITRIIVRKVRSWNGEKYVTEYDLSKTETTCEGVLPISVGVGEWRSTDGRYKFLGVPGAESVIIKVAPIMIGWTNDAGKTFQTDEDAIKRHGLKSAMELLKEYPLREAPQWH